MTEYDPDRVPEPAVWLALDEAERLAIVEAFHMHARVEIPRPRLHAAIHVVVENQIAAGIPDVVAALQRLQQQGLTRHDALHAVGALVAEQLHQAVKKANVEAGRRSLTDEYLERVRALDAADLEVDA